MIKYKITNNNAVITPVEIERESDHFIWINGQQNKKHSDFVHYFDSRYGAYKKLVEDAKIMKKNILLDISDDAASYRTDMSGWVSHNGLFFGEDELAARYNGCTHVLCRCGQPVEKSHIRCPNCQKEYNDKKFAALEQKKWDGKSPLSLFGEDQFFFDLDELADYAVEGNYRQGEFKLVLCEPVCAWEISPYDIYDGENELPTALMDAFDDLNQFIRENREVLYWKPSKYAAII